MPRVPRLWNAADGTQDNNNWGAILNAYLGVSHNADGTLKTAEIIGLQAGTLAARPASPTAGNVYIATDTNELFYCAVAGRWWGDAQRAVDIRSFGAVVGTGATAAQNDAAFAAAYTELQNTGISLYVPSGTYAVATEIQTYQMSIIGAWDNRPVIQPTAALTARTFRIGSATIDDVADRTILENLVVDLVNASNGHVAIEGTRAVSNKTLRRLRITRSDTPGTRATVATSNHTGIKLVFAAGQSASYNNFEFIELLYMFTGINLNNIANGISAAADPRFINITSTVCYRQIIVNAVNPLLLDAHLSVPTDINVSSGDYMLTMISQGGIVKNLWLDQASATAGAVRVDGRTQIIGGNVAFSSLQEVDTANVAVADLNAAPPTNLIDNQGLYARDAQIRDTKPNWIVNPDFRWWFRGTSFASPATGTVTAEGWKTFRQGTNTYTIDKETGGANLQYSAQSLKLTVSAAGSAGAPSGGIEQDLTADFGYRHSAYVGRNMSLGVIARGAAGGETLYVNAFGTVQTYTLTTSFGVYVVTAANPNVDMSIIIGLADGTTGTVYLDTVMLYPGAYYASSFRPHTLNEKWETAKAPFTVIGGKIHYSGTAAPTTGTWAQGDFVWNTAPSGATPTIGWSCTVAGTPGTWVAVVAN